MPRARTLDGVPHSLCPPPQILSTLLFAVGCMFVIVAPSFCFRDPLARYRGKADPASLARRAMYERELERTQAEIARRRRKAGAGAGIAEGDEEEEAAAADAAASASAAPPAGRAGPYVRLPQEDASETAARARQQRDSCGANSSCFAPRRPAAATRAGGYARVSTAEDEHS